MCEGNTNKQKRSFDADAPDAQAAPPPKRSRNGPRLVEGEHEFDHPALKEVKVWLDKTARAWKKFAPDFFKTTSSLGKRARLELEADGLAHVSKRMRVTRTHSVLGKRARSIADSYEDGEVKRRRHNTWEPLCRGEDCKHVRDPHNLKRKVVKKTALGNKRSHVLDTMLVKGQVDRRREDSPEVIAPPCDYTAGPVPAPGEIVYDTIELGSPSTDESFNRMTESPKSNRSSQSSLSPPPPSRVPTPALPQKKGLSGLHNISNACFSNAVIQMLDVALDSAQKVALRGDDQLQDFSQDEREVAYKLQGFSWSTRSKVGKTYRKMVDRLKHPETSIRKAAYLGQLLDDIQQGVEGQQDVSPVLFQQAFAHNGPEAKPRYDGSTQQDAGEYLEDVLSMLRTESALTDAAFRIDSKTKKTCGRCGHETEDFHDAYHLAVPAIHKKAELATLIELQLDRTEDVPHKTCDGCQQKGFLDQRDTVESLPDKFFIQLGRADTSSRVTFPFEQRLQLPQGKYVVSAVIYRDGDDFAFGHYRCLARQEDGWALFDDKMVSRNPNLDRMRDGSRAVGLSTVLLLKRCS